MASSVVALLFAGFNLGLWQDSYKNASAERRWDTCQEAKSYWQWGVVATIAFSMSFALLAVMLSFSGVLAATLSSKIYYYHSAGEIYIICAASFAASLVLYPFVTELERNLSTSHAYGHGYLAGWIATLVFLASSFFLCLDDIFRLTVRGLGYCNPDGTQNARI
ncbi:hypothetical protein NP493_143g02020 [Ridgeia piscesae]|uniref:Uncharacterized protein n=1 Tax=Ridgeia piscesae TaxID=27915 RepID=A0AAD9P512_RIDPI|nr:hypothetical protein NP493_143g02020 [Ridgeia piscesae]